MARMEAVLLKETPRQRYYSLGFKVVNIFGSLKTGTIAELFKDDPLRLKDQWELAEDISSSVDKICVSDAHTHTERLVFPAFYVRNKETGEVFLSHRNNRIDGKMTMMIYGGDHGSVYPDKVYIRHLRMANKNV